MANARLEIHTCNIHATQTQNDCNVNAKVMLTIVECMQYCEHVEDKAQCKCDKNISHVCTNLPFFSVSARRELPHAVSKIMMTKTHTTQLNEMR